MIVPVLSVRDFLLLLSSDDVVKVCECFEIIHVIFALRSNPAFISIPVAFADAACRRSAGFCVVNRQTVLVVTADELRIAVEISICLCHLEITTDCVGHFSCCIRVFSAVCGIVLFVVNHIESV